MVVRLALWEAPGLQWHCFVLFFTVLFFVPSKSKVLLSILLITLLTQTRRTSEVKIKVLSVALREWLR